MQQHLIRTYQVIREGVPRPGRQSLLDNIYVQPQISTCGHGGVDLSRELRAPPPSSLQVPSADTFIVMNELFRLQRDGGRLVRTVLTTGVPGIGLSVSVGKFCLDWALQRANKVTPSFDKQAVHFLCSTKQQTHHHRRASVVSGALLHDLFLTMSDYTDVVSKIGSVSCPGERPRYKYDTDYTPIIIIASVGSESVGQSRILALVNLLQLETHLALVFSVVV